MGRVEKMLSSMAHGYVSHTGFVRNEGVAGQTFRVREQFHHLHQSGNVVGGSGFQ